MNEIVKIEKVTAENIKAISNFIAVFEGKSAHITGKNGYGKSTLIRVLIDKLKGLEPAIVIKIGEKEGLYEMELTDGGRFVWEFNSGGKEKINYFTKDSLTPVKREIFKAIVERYFPNEFDINKFLTTTAPRERLDMISKLINVDLTEVQERYKSAFKNRADEKRTLKLMQAGSIQPPRPICLSHVNIDAEQKEIALLNSEMLRLIGSIQEERNRLNAEYLNNKAENENLQIAHDSEYSKILDAWQQKENETREEIEKFNDRQKARARFKSEFYEISSNIKEIISKLSEYCNNSLDTDAFYSSIKREFLEIPSAEPFKVYEPSKRPEKSVLTLPDPMPSDTNLKALLESEKELKIKLEEAKYALSKKQAANTDFEAKKAVYDIQYNQYRESIDKIEKQQVVVNNCEDEVEAILNEIKAIVKAAKLPDEFSIDLTNRNDILFRTAPDAEYLPITNETLASSAIYIAAFKLHAFHVDIFRVVHFDVSFLDYENREIVAKEAKKMNIQLLAESPAYSENEKELQYILIE